MNETQLWYCDICHEAIILKVNQKISIVNLINTKKNLVLLLKNMNLLNQILMK